MTTANGLAVRDALEAAGVEFIDENSGGPNSSNSSLIAIDKAAVTEFHWQPSEPHLNCKELAYELKQTSKIDSVALSERAI